MNNNANNDGWILKAIGKLFRALPLSFSLVLALGSFLSYILIANGMFNGISDVEAIDALVDGLTSMLIAFSLVSFIVFLVRKLSLRYRMFEKSLHCKVDWKRISKESFNAAHTLKGIPKVKGDSIELVIYRRNGLTSKDANKGLDKLKACLELSYGVLQEENGKFVKIMLSDREF